MTKGGVMIGSTVSTRSVFLKRKPVRVTISAKARPSTVVPAPQHSARNSVFQATPQRPPPDEAAQAPDLLRGQPFDQQRRHEGAVAVLEGLRQDAQDRPGGEQQDRGRHGRHGAGHEGVAAEGAAQRQADREQRQQRDQHDRGAGADADLPAFDLAEQGVEPGGASSRAGRCRRPVRRTARVRCPRRGRAACRVARASWAAGEREAAQRAPAATGASHHLPCTSDLATPLA